MKRNTANLLRVHAFVPGHGWLEFEASNTAYAEGLSLYQHKKIAEWAKSRNIAFSTEVEQLAARNALIEHILELAPDLSTRERRAAARMAGNSVPDTSDVQHEFADPSPSGTRGEIAGEIIDDRSDALVDPAPPKRQKRVKPEPTTKEQEEAQLLSDLKNIDWEQPIDEDMVMEEHR